MEQAHDYRLSHHHEIMEERHLDEVHLKEILHAEMKREKQYYSTISLYYYAYRFELQIITWQIDCREREERERKKRRLNDELKQCIKMQKQWRAIQRLIEAEEDRLIEECVKQKRRLSQMQQEERREKAHQLASIRQQLKRALEMEEASHFFVSF